MKKILSTFFCFVFCLHVEVLARKPCSFKSKIKSERKLSESYVASEGTTMFLLEGFQDNCFIDLDSVFELILNKTQTDKNSGNTTEVLKECFFDCSEKISIHFFINATASSKSSNLFVALSFARCYIFMQELSLFANYASIWSIIQSSDSSIHVPSKRINCIFSEYLIVIHSKLHCESKATFFWEYCEEVFKKVNILQLEACASNHVSIKAETLIKRFPQVQDLQLKYIDLCTELTFPWTQLYVDATDVKTFVSNRVYKNASVNSLGRMIQIHNSDIINMVHLSGRISNIVIIDANFSKNQSEIFRNVTGLYHVEISNHQMTEVTPNLFKNQTDIKYISLQDNQLQTIPENIFEDQRHLLFLDLSKNKLCDIDQNLLKNQHFLEELHLESNSIQAFPDNFLKEQIGSLKFLYLYSNPIKTIPVMPFYGARIEIIDIHRSKITGESLIELANNINTYDFIYADDARKTSNPKQKDGKESFQRSVLDLSFCNIRDIRMNLNVKNRTSMNMLLLVKSFNIKGDGNPFKCNCELYVITLLFTIKDIHSLKLDWVCSYPDELKGRKVTSLTDQDIYCPVNVSDCPKSCVCYVRYDFSSLIIDCRNIKMETMPILMPKDPLELWFKNTSLLELEQRDYLVNVSVLDISENKLTHIQPLVASKLQNVSVLKIENNHFTSLPVQIRYTNIKRLYLDGNSFKCDCHTKWMKPWLLDRSCPVTDWNNIKCTDNSKRVKTFVTIPDSAFVCQEVEKPSIAEHIIFPSTIIGSLMFVIVVLSLIIYVQRFTVRVLLYAIFGRRICNSFSKDSRDSKYDCVVIYGKSDENFVNDKVKGHLKELRYKVADIYCDSIIGFTFIDGIKQLIYSSNVNIFCLTENSLNNDLITAIWNIACERSRKSTLSSIILIVDKVFRSKCTWENMRLFIRNGRYIKIDSILLHKSMEYLLPPKQVLNHNQKGHEHRHPRELDIEEMEEVDNMTLMEGISRVTANTDVVCSAGRRRDIYIVYPDDMDELHKLVRYELIPFLKDRNQNASVLQDDFIFGEDIREGIEPRLDEEKHVIFILTKEMFEDEVWQYIVSTILTKAFIFDSNYLLLLTYGEIDENTISENLKKFVNSHITASVSDPKLKERILEALLCEASRASDKEDNESLTLENSTENENLI